MLAKMPAYFSHLRKGQACGLLNFLMVGCVTCQLVSACCPKDSYLLIAWLTTASRMPDGKMPDSVHDGMRWPEDGDSKGYQSRKGHEAKTEENIESWTLPPRTPGWMPLDFCLWKEIEDRMMASKKSGPETKAAFEARLRKTALRLPKSLVKSCLAKMKSNIKATVQSKGKSTVLD